ncbi:MAG: peptidase [Chromatiaceae bacterium]|nr:MAG: peptidase [Chromatiaceae bacterium]
MNQEAFFTLTERLQGHLQGSECLFANLHAETTDFVRLNQNRIRQAGQVQSAGLGLTLIDGARQIEGDCTLSGDPAADLALASGLLTRLRERLPQVPDDPYLNYSTEPTTSNQCQTADLPAPAAAVEQLIALAAGLDLVGIWASGRLASGLASSLGHRHWHQSESFHLDWSCHLDHDKAVKDSLAGRDWQPDLLAARLAAQRERLELMARPQRTLAPGRYRAYLAPAAVAELLELLGWGGFGLKDHRTRQSPLQALADGTAQLAPTVTLTEEHRRGLAPGFTAEGFVLPPTVTLIDAGRFGTCLTDARSGREYDQAVNAGNEAPEALAMTAGDLPADAILERLGEGLYISNLWYCNWSDRNTCRLTGMTRFGSAWVEQGRLAAPLAVMRFDDSLYRLLGEHLEAIGAERELLLSADTYDGRTSASSLLPGLLVSGIELAL